MGDEASTILVVDDNESNRDLLLRRLRRSGYQTLSATNGREAIAVVENESVDLVLLDIMMPGIDGVEVLQILRKTHSTARLPVIMVTARTESEPVVETLGMGANDYVTKPINFPVLAARLEAQLARKKAEDALQDAHQNLERLVEERTSELQERNTQLAAEVERRKVLQEELSKKSTFLQATFDHMSDALQIVDDSCAIVGFNENYYRLLDLPPDSIRVGDPLEKLIRFLAERGDLGPGDPAAITAKRMEIARKFQPESFERETPGGSFLHIRTNSFPGGGFVAIITDITERKMSQQELLASEQRLRAITDNLSGGLFRRVLKPDGAVTYAFATRQLLEIFEIDRVEDFRGASLNALAETDKIRLAAAITESAANLTELELETEHVFPSGKRKWLYTVSQPRRKENGDVIWDALLLDVTDRKLAEQALRLRDRAIDASNSGILITDCQQPDSPIIFANPAFERITGYSEDDVLGRNCRFLSRDDRDQPELDTIREAIEEGKNCQVTLRNYRKDGSLFWNELNLAPVHDNEGKITHFVGIQIDATERKETESQLQRAQKLNALGHLTGGIAHDFNNILAVILGNVQLLERRVDDPRAKKRAQAAVEAAKRGASLTNRLLAFSRGQMMEPSVVILHDFLKDAFELLRRTVDESVEIVFDLSADSWPARVDPSQFENAILNLVVNARDAIDGGGTITIKTRNLLLDADTARNYPSLDAGDYVEVSVADTGVGMSRDVAEQAFDPFFTTKETDKGTGLGLSMVYAFANQSSGVVVINSEVDRGTTVRILLPRWRGETPAATAPNAIGLTAVKGNESILVVEDNTSVREVAVEIIEDLGYRVLAAENGLQALRVLDETGDIDLVFSDVVMPGGMDGPTFVAEAVRQRPALKVLFTTGYNESAVLRTGINNNDADVITKPYTDGELAIKLREVLDRKMENI